MTKEQEKRSIKEPVDLEDLTFAVSRIKDLLGDKGNPLVSKNRCYYESMLSYLENTPQDEVLRLAEEMRIGYLKLPQEEGRREALVEWGAKMHNLCPVPNSLTFLFSDSRADGHKLGSSFSAYLSPQNKKV